jgi:DNA-binding NarL/FixJ family response regulator
MAIKVGIIEDHRDYRESLNHLIRSANGMELVWEFASVEKAVENYVPADVILLDINLPGISGVEAIPLLKQQGNKPAILMLTIVEDDACLFRAIKNGADGYLLKKANPNKIVGAIRQVFSGEVALTPVVARQIFDQLKPGKEGLRLMEQFTPRETEILRLICRGESNERIARELFISIDTVRNHVKKIYGKLQVNSRAEAIVKMYREKLV